jgi:hypothetical protein
MAIVDLWADPSCPWTWLTAQWLLEVGRSATSGALPRDEPVPAQRGPRRPTAELAPLMGPGAGVGVRGRPCSLGPGRDAARCYVALAGLIHQHGRSTYDRDLYAAALHRSGLPHTLANAADSPFYDEALRASHHAGVDPAGDELGCPIVQLRRARTASWWRSSGGGVRQRPGRAVRRPVRLWDSVALAAETGRILRAQAGPHPTNRSSSPRRPRSLAHRCGNACPHAKAGRPHSALLRSSSSSRPGRWARLIPWWLTGWHSPDRAGGLGRRSSCTTRHRTGE